jgi:hypothetical protein
MKTYEDWIEQQDPTKTIPLKDAWNAAIETMRQDCEPVFYADAVAVDYAKANNDKFDISVGVRNASNKIDTDIPLYTQPQPLRELSRKEIMKLWNRAWEESSSVHQVEHFAKLVREAK